MVSRNPSQSSTQGFAARRKGRSRRSHIVDHHPEPCRHPAPFNVTMQCSRTDLKGVLHVPGSCRHGEPNLLLAVPGSQNRGHRAPRAFRGRTGEHQRVVHPTGDPTPRIRRHRNKPNLLRGDLSPPELIADHLAQIPTQPITPGSPRPELEREHLLPQLILVATEPQGPIPWEPLGSSIDSIMRPVAFIGSRVDAGSGGAIRLLASRGGQTNDGARLTGSRYPG